ncbi:MAG: sulfite exporter TauE/SafE family protein [Bacteroidota bacterium]
MIFSGFLMGFIGSLHCLGMCGPISLALPIPRDSLKKKWIGLGVYNSGRLLTYSMLGGLFGLFGTGINLLGLQQGISIFFGIMILLGLVGLTVSHYFQSQFQSSSVMKWIKNAIGKSFKKGNKGFLAAGLLNGLIPCGLVYMAIAVSISQTSHFEGALFMLSFGLGTLPAMIGVNWLPKLFQLKKQLPAKKLITGFSFLVALLFIYRGIALEIPPLNQLLEETAFAKISACGY